MSKPKKQLSGISEEALRAGRDALLECIVAVEEVDHFPRQIENADSLADLFCQQITRLYKVLREGWVPICTCWPRVIEIDSDPSLELNPPADVQTRLAARFWNQAKNTFWLCVFFGNYTRSAVEAWDRWVEVLLAAAERSVGISLDCFQKVCLSTAGVP